MTQPVISRKARFWPNIPTEVIKLPSSPAAPMPPSATTLIPLALGLAGVVLSGWLFTQGGAGGGGYLLAFLALSAFTALGSLITYFIQRVTSNQQIAFLQQRYHDSIKAAELAVGVAHKLERQARLNLDPPFMVQEHPAKSYEEMAIAPIARVTLDEHNLQLWARQPSDPNFLAPRVGMGWMPAACRVEGAPAEAVTLPSPFDELQDRARRLVTHATTILAPVTLPLAEQPVVTLLAQSRELHHARSLARSLAMQLAYHHSAEDMRLVILAPRSQESGWLWARDLPHVRVNDLNTSGGRQIHALALALGKDDIAERLAWLSRELSRRELTLGRAGERREAPLPRLVIIIDYFDAGLDGDSLVLGTQMHAGTLTSSGGSQHLPWQRPEMTLALSRAAELGVAIITIATEPTEVPSTASVVVNLQAEDKVAGYVRSLHPNPETPTRCSLFDESEPTELRRLSLAMRGLRQASAKRPQLRTRVDLRDLFEPEFDATTPTARWNDPSLRLSAAQLNGAKPVERLIAPVGFKLGDELQLLDLVKDGPHGLLIGQTGSGKSELLGTMIAAFAINYRPTELNFLLIDFKGGLGLEQFSHLPHTVGFLTNAVSAAYLDRFMAMLTAEYIRRETIQRANKLHPNDPHTPLPRLFIIIDEFAEAANLMSEAGHLNKLYTIMRVGRSLGMHLLFASQTPEGVVSRMSDYVQYRFCLRVANDQHSREVIGRPDAAALPVSAPGRAYFLHGDNQLDLFQSARTSLPVEPKERI